VEILCWLCVMKEQFVWFVGNFLIRLVVFWGWLVCWKYCCLCILMNVDVVFVYDNIVDVDVKILGIVNCLCWFDVDVVFVYDKLV
jgi:hypothetical protein